MKKKSRKQQFAELQQSIIDQLPTLSNKDLVEITLHLSESYGSDLFSSDGVSQQDFEILEMYNRELSKRLLEMKFIDAPLIERHEDN